MSAVILKKADGSPPPIPFDDEQRAKKLIASNHFLSPEKEVGPFMLYLLGRDHDSIAVECGIPRDIVLATAVHYRWREKRIAIVEVGKESELIKEVEKNLINSLLLATWRLAMQEVGQVMSGKLPAAACRFVPHSMQGLEKLLAIAERVNKLIAADEVSRHKADEKPASATTVVHAQNVQINQGAPEGEKKLTPEERRITLLAEMARATEVKSE